MALHKCYNCGQMISDRAKACPKCGASQSGQPQSAPEYQEEPPRGNKSALIVVAIIGMALLVALGIVVFVPQMASYSPSEAVAEQVAAAEAAEEVVQPAVEATELSSNRSPGDGHYSMTGRLADLPIEMQFTISGRYVNGTLIYTGISLTSVEDGLEIYGEIDGDNLVLNEINERGERSGNFVGTMRDGRYTGTFHRYRNGRNDKDFSFYLHQ